MKTKLLLFACVLFLFTACEEGLTVDVSTNLSQEVDVEAIETTLKTSGIVFDEEVDLNFEDNEDLKEHLENIKEMDFEETSFTISGLADSIIVDVTATLPKYGISQTFTGIKNGSIIKLDAANGALLNSKADDIIAAKKIKVKVSGTATDESTFKIKINFKIKITAGL